MTKLLIFDMDGTLRRPKSESTFINDPLDQSLIPGVKEALDYYASDGWYISGCSNQGGVEKGYKTFKSAIAEQRVTLQLLLGLEPVLEPSCEAADEIDRQLSESSFLGVLFCPDYEGRECYRISKIRSFDEVHRSYDSARYVGNFRKPQPGMIQYWVDCFAERILYIGDRPEDEQAAANAKVPFLWAQEWHKRIQSGDFSLEVGHDN